MYGIGYISRTLADTLQVGNGLGKPTIKFEFEDNQALADFLTKTKGNVDYAETVDADTFSNPMTVNNRRQSRKAAQQKALTDTTTNYLPPSDGTPSLPPSPTSPKALPPSPTTPTTPTTYKSPLQREYDRIKEKYPNSLVLFRVGDFFEAWGDDATVISIALNLPLTKRGDMNLIAIPYAAIDKYLPKLVQAGYRVALSEQTTQDEKVLPLNLTEPTPEPTTPEVEPQPQTTNPQSDKTVKFKPKKRAKKPLEIEYDNINYITRDIPAFWMDVPQSSITDTYLDDWWNFAERSHPYPQNIVSFVQIDERDNGRYIGKYYQFFFKDRDKDFVSRNMRNPKKIISKDGYFVVTTLAEIDRIQDALIDDDNRHLVIFEPHIYNDGLGKPTIKLEFEDNGELMNLFNTDGISGLTVNDKPAAVFNCPESELNTQGFAPTYIRLADYSHLIDAADGNKTLKGYGFEKATLDELVNACQNYRQVERLAAHLQDPDEMQSAFNVWHWLHTNVRYNYDTPGEEEIRTPARVWADRESGVDCDCLAVFTACLLICMGYKPKFEIVAFNNSPTFSHIYVNLDGMAIDRVLPVFLARPGNITKTQIMDIPVYSLSGIDGCNTLSGVYASTLAKVQDGTATGEDLNNLRKTEVLLTLKGLDDDEYKLAKILMPYVVTIGDDGKYYFDNAKLAAVAQKVDAELALLKQQNASPEAMTQWLAKVLDQLDGVSVDAQTPSDDDTIVVIINPKGCPCQVCGNMVSAELPTLTPQSIDDTSQQTLPSSMFATTPYPTVEPSTEEPQDNTLWWITGICAALGMGAALMSKGSTKTRKRR